LNKENEKLLLCFFASFAGGEETEGKSTTISLLLQLAFFQRQEEVRKASYVIQAW
jgi:hypothetical protein